MTDIIIPAKNEAETIRHVVRTALSAGVGRVIVVNDRSTDQTANIARSAGASVITGPGIGKGQAMAAGLARVTTPRVIFLDADLYGLRPEHVRFLAGNNGGMIVGHREGSYIPWLPSIAGERSLPTATAKRTRLYGYGAETALNAQIGREHLPVDNFIMAGVRGKVRAGPIRLANVAPHAVAHAPGLLQYMMNVFPILRLCHRFRCFRYAAIFQRILG